MTTLCLDHIVIAAERLEDGVAHVEEALGVRLAPGGKHALMGTHNRLLKLGAAYLEVIAIDPDAPPPDRARWFDLDRFSGDPRLTNWVAGTSDLAAAMATAPAGMGTAQDVRRGTLRWSMAVPDDGKLPFGGGFPGLIEWRDAAHPTDMLPESGCALADWTVSHPDPALKAALERFDGPLARHIRTGPFGFHAVIDTPHGPRALR